MEAARAAQGGRRKNLSLSPASRARRQKESFDAAFESFYREHVAEVYQYALAVLGNSPDAEDVTQQTFLNAYRAFQRGERPHKPHNWLIKIAHNVCRMRWRQASRRPQEISIDNLPEVAGPDTSELPDLAEVLEALAALTLNQRAAVVVRGIMASRLVGTATAHSARRETVAYRRAHPRTSNVGLAGALGGNTRGTGLTAEPATSEPTTTIDSAISKLAPKLPIPAPVKKV